MTMPAALGLTRTRSRTPSPASDAEPARGVRASVVRALSGKREPRTVVVPRRPARDGCVARHAARGVADRVLTRGAQDRPAETRAAGGDTHARRDAGAQSVRAARVVHSRACR
jgi:hypothetical protein